MGKSGSDCRTVSSQSSSVLLLLLPQPLSQRVYQPEFLNTQNQRLGRWAVGTEFGRHKRCDCKSRARNMNMGARSSSRWSLVAGRD